MEQIRAETLAEKMFTDMMASAGVGYSRIAQELLFFIPRSFRDAYTRLFHAGLSGADAGVDQKGTRDKQTGDLGRAAGANSGVGVRGDKGGHEVRAVSKSGGKKYRKYWTIDDERAVELRDRIDKRLRAMAREIEEEMASWGTNE